MFLPLAYGAYVLMFGVLSSVEALDNGLALTPPMGWLSWLKYRCNTNCYGDFTQCISEHLIKRTADLMESEGYLAAGYEYIILDDCWQGPGSGHLPDPRRFPSGMKALAEYVHSKGLKFGLLKYVNQIELSVDTMASWGVDYIKIIHYKSKHTVKEDYTALSHEMNETGRPMFYSCSWPLWEEELGIHSDYREVAKHCNSWRSYDNVEGSWTSVLEKINWFGDNQNRIAPFTGPGRWSDPDQLAVGNNELTVDQAKVQMAIWSIWAAPLLMSIDPGTVHQDFKDILLNRDIIAVNQDKLGQQGLRVWKGRNLQIWARELSEGCYAIAFVNLRNEAVDITFQHDEMNLPQLNYVVKDLFNIEKERLSHPFVSFAVKINPTGVKFYKFIPY